MNLELDSNRRLKKLRNKKTKWIKSKLNIFNSLNENLEIEKFEKKTVLTLQEIKIEKFRKKHKLKIPSAQRKLNYLLKLVSAGSILNEKEIKRYVKCCRELDIAIPIDIKTKHDLMRDQRQAMHRQRVAATIARKEAKIKLKEGKKKKKRPRSYKTYINSVDWENRKNLLFKERSRQCELCGSYRYIQVHHLRYDRKMFGKEPSSDLAILCDVHHKQFHEEYGVKKDCHENYAIYKDNFLKGLIPTSFLKPVL